MNRVEIITSALRMIGVAPHDDAPTADMTALAGGFLDTIYAEITAQFWTDEEGTVTAAWTLANVPAQAAIPLAQVLASDVAPSFGVQAPPRQWARLAQTLRSYAGISEDDDVRFF